MSNSNLRVLLLAAVLGAAPALAQSASGPGRAARLLDSPVAPAQAAPSAVNLVPTGSEAASDGPGYGVHFGKTYGVSVLASTAGVLLGTMLGSLSNELIWAALPVLLSNLFVGPVVTTLFAMLIGNDGGPGRYGFWAPAGVAFGLNAVLFAVVSLAGMALSYLTPGLLLAYSLVDGLLMTGSSVGMMHLLGKKVEATTITSYVPGVSDTRFAALTTVRF